MAVLPQPFDPDLGGALIEAAGTPGFSAALLTAAQRCDSVDEVFAYWIAEGTAPQPLVSWSEVGDCRERAQLYSRRFFRLDPAGRVRLDTAIGQGFAYRMRPEQIANKDYRAICFERPRFKEKLCFGWKGRSRSIVLNFYRQGRADDNPVADERLAALAHVGLSILANELRRSSIPPAPLFARVEERLARAFPELSPRERTVCARTLAGWSAEQIAAELGIRPATVLTYRQRAYQRFGFSGASDFLDQLLN